MRMNAVMVHTKSSVRVGMATVKEEENNKDEKKYIGATDMNRKTVKLH